MTLNRQLIQCNKHLILTIRITSRTHQILVASPAIVSRSALADFRSGVEALCCGTVFVFRLFVAAVLKQRADYDGVGGEGYEENVEGGEEGAELLFSVPGDHARELSERNGYAH